MPYIVNLRSQLVTSNAQAIDTKEETTGHEQAFFDALPPIFRTSRIPEHSSSRGKCGETHW
jgi:hypothetical protein